MSVDLETYDGQVARLDVDYIRSSGEALRARLFPRENREGITPFPLPAALSYQPQNGSNYQLVFVPCRTIRQVSAEVNEPTAAWNVPSGIKPDDPNWVLVCRVGGTDDFAHPFDMQMGQVFVPDYVSSTLGLNWADGCAITALFRAITASEIV